MRFLLTVAVLVVATFFVPQAIRAQDTATVHFSLDSSAVSLAAVPWRFHPGDNLSWAEPDVDDSDWHLVSPTADDTRLVGEYVALAYHGKRAHVPDFNAEITEDYDPSISTVSLVPEDIGRVLINLIGNAFDAVREKAASSGDDFDPAVAVSTKRKSDGGAEIRVVDNGPGVPEAIRSRIFEPFFTTKPTGAGSGIGLSLSHDIVTNGHGGSLAVETNAVGGATFVVTLPANSLADQVL